MIGFGFGVPSFGPKELDRAIEIDQAIFRATHKTLNGVEWHYLANFFGIFEIVQECSDYLIVPKDGESYQKFFSVEKMLDKIIKSKFYIAMNVADKRRVIETLEYSSDGNIFMQQKLLWGLTETTRRAVRNLKGNRPDCFKSEFEALKDPKETSKKTKIKTKKATV